MLMKLRFKIDEEEFVMLRAHFMPDAATITELDNAENCWEDVTNASLSYLLKHSLGKGGKTSALNV